jgi:hypothetical protein
MTSASPLSEKLKVVMRRCADVWNAEFAPHPRRIGCVVVCSGVTSSIILFRVENVDTLLHHLKVREEDHVDDGRAEDRNSKSYLGAESV